MGAWSPIAAILLLAGLLFGLPACLLCNAVVALHFYDSVGRVRNNTMRQPASQPYADAVLSVTEYCDRTVLSLAGAPLE